VLRGQHQHQGRSIAKYQQVSGSQEHAQVGAPTIQVGEHGDQARREADPAPPAEHAAIGAQGVTEKARRPSSVKALAVGGLRLSLPLEEVRLLAGAAFSGGEQGPAVGGDLQGGLKEGQAGMCRPGG